MKLKLIENRNTAMDIIRITAVFFVIGIHFFLNSGFYSETIRGTKMYILFVIQTFSFVCIPLFLILSGYLMNKKTFSKKYYCGIVKTLLVYLFACIACTVFKTLYFETPISFKSFLLSVLNFTGAPYGWYIELYIGLFLLIPFFNIMYNKLESKRNKQVLLLTLISITILPSVFNIFSFTSDTLWFKPEDGDIITQLVPDWWKNFYPMTYYITGCYLREYGLKIKTPVVAVLLVGCTLIFSTFNYFRCYGNVFKGGQHTDWNGFEPYILGVLFFVLLSRIKTNKFPIAIKRVLCVISSATLGMYLVSYIFDTVVYVFLNRMVVAMPDRLVYFLPTVLIIFICSMIFSFILNAVIKIIYVVCREIKNIVVMIKAEPQIDITGTPTDEADTENIIVSDKSTKIRGEHSRKETVKK